VLDANAAPGPDTIRFEIAGGGVDVIAPRSPLPALNDVAVIDGTSQPGYAGTPLVVLDGSAAGPDADGLTLAGAAVVRGLGVNRFGRDGIVLLGAGVVEGCYVGITSDGRSAAGNGGAGVRATGAGAVVGGAAPGAGNVISGNGSSGVFVGPAARADVKGNRIGTDAAGTAAVPNGTSPTQLYRDGVTVNNGALVNVGGPSVAERNLISGNLGSGVQVVGSAGTVYVRGNFIGTDAAGNTALMNAGDGVTVIGLTLGGARWVQGNLISGNGRNGIRMWGENAFAGGNYIGTNAAGNAAVANGGDGIQAEDTVLSVGSTEAPTITSPVIDPAATTRNIISGNRGHGVHGIRSSGSIGNNYVGTDATGTARLGNGGDGMFFEGVVPRIGWGLRQPPAGFGNLISANRGNGITVVGGTGESIRPSIVGNRIGTDAAGNPLNNALGNGGHGIAVINSTRIRVGGEPTSTLAGPNTIAFNGGSGVYVEGNDPTSTSNPATAEILRNSIFSNRRLGIDLASPRDPADGVTPNDPRDGDRGPNSLMNFPVLTAATPFFHATRVALTMQAEPNRTFRVEFFESAAPDPSGYGEGRSFVGFVMVTVDGDGNLRTIVTIPAARPSAYLAATATDNGQTSEFSSAVRVGGVPRSRRVPYAVPPAAASGPLPPSGAARGLFCPTDLLC
jgi:hypothetical protein